MRVGTARPQEDNHEKGLSTSSSAAVLVQLQMGVEHPEENKGGRFSRREGWSAVCEDPR